MTESQQPLIRQDHKCSSVVLLFRPGRKLVGDRTVKSQLSLVSVTESQFADDVVLYTFSWGKLESVVQSFVGKAGQWV